MKTKAALSIMMVSALYAGVSQASVTAEEVSQLGTTLTPWGAEVKGNAEGTIPDYTGGMTKPPANYVEGSGRWVDPWPDEKPLLKIDATNVDQHADKVTPGVQELIRRWPDSYHLNIYTTKRTWPAMSEDRAAKTIANATDPECKTFSEGVGLSKGCIGGIPFPIPKTGYEVMWNHLVSERFAPGYEGRGANLVVDAAGNLSTPMHYEASRGNAYWADGNDDDYYLYSTTNIISPARDAGNKTLVWYPLRYDERDQRTWSYSTGQRRVRLAPEFSYDTPNAGLGGVIYFDEAQMFAGRMDRFDFELIGKKEMYIPYNTYKGLIAPIDVQIGKQHFNPDVLRWELRRVWVVEATVKEGMRHSAKRRTFYIEEDSWSLMAVDGVDQSDKIFRVLLSFASSDYISGVGGVDFQSAMIGYELARGGYTVVSSQGDPKAYYKPLERLPANLFTPEAMGGRGVR